MSATATQIPGFIVAYRHDRGFGFVRALDSKPSDRQRDLFFHFSSVQGPGAVSTIREGEPVRFVVGIGDDGRPRALEVHRA